MGLYYMKKFEQYSRHLQLFCRAEQEDITNEFIISGITIILQEARSRICDWINNAIIDICQ